MNQSIKHRHIHHFISQKQENTKTANFSMFYIYQCKSRFAYYNITDYE